MTRVIAVVRGLGASLVSALISLISFVLVGVFLPIWAMMLVYDSNIPSWNQRAAQVDSG
jgi:hypothetical protein